MLMIREPFEVPFLKENEFYTAELSCVDSDTRPIEFGCDIGETVTTLLMMADHWPEFLYNAIREGNAWVCLAIVNRTTGKTTWRSCGIEIPDALTLTETRNCHHIKVVHTVSVTDRK